MQGPPKSEAYSGVIGSRINVRSSDSQVEPSLIYLGKVMQIEEFRIPRQIDQI